MKLELTIENIKDIYRAGIRRGHDEATAFEWGTHTSHPWITDLEEAVYDILNEGKDFDDESRILYDDVQRMLK